MNIRKSLENLDIGEVGNVEELDSGFQSTIYLAEIDNEKYCVRICRKRTKRELGYELKILELLSDLKVVKPIEVDGEKIVKIGEKNAIIYPYVEGRHVACPDKNQVSQAGEFMGKFHSITEGFEWDKERFEWYNLPDSRIVDYVETIHDSDIPYKEELPDIVRELRENRLPHSLPKGAIHVDFSPANTLYNKKELAAVLDFDNSYIGPLVLDVGKGLMFFSSYKEKFDAEKMKAFYDAYSEERKLTNEEYENLYNAVKFAFLSHVFVDYYMYATGVTTREYFDYIVNDLYASYKDFDMEKEEFYEFMKK